MSPQDFTFWLQGFLEIENPVALDERQTQIVKDHLKLVFEKQTPNRDFQCNTGTGSLNPFPNGVLIC